MKRLTILAMMFLVSTAAYGLGCDGNGNCYIYASSTCSSSCGATWAAAYNGIGSGSGEISPSGMTRGVTYWIAAGSYGSITFSTADSGTSVITLEAATTANHGPDSTWSNSYAGQALLGEEDISTDYWTFNGQASSGCTYPINNDSCYNLKFWNQSDSEGVALVTTGNNVTVEYTEIEGTDPDYTGSNADDGVHFGGNDLEMEYNWIHDMGVDAMVATGGDAEIIERNMFDSNAKSAASEGHVQAFRLCNSNTGPTDFVLRYNIYRNIQGSGTMDTASASGCLLGPGYIYGNTIYWTSSFTHPYDIVDGFIGFFGEETTGQLDILNNTIAAVTCDGCTQTLIWLSAGTQGGTCPTFSAELDQNCGSPTVRVENNLFYNTPGSDYALDCEDGGSPPSCGTHWTPNTVDYQANYCPNGGCTNGGYGSSGYTTGTGSAGTHDSSATGNPFVDFDGSANFNFHLASNTTAGASPSSWSTTPSTPSFIACTSGVNCENVDASGVVRTGTVSRGAFQYTTATPPAAVTGVTVTGATVQ